MNTTTNHYVQINRTDGSRTYKGPLPYTRAEFEAATWREAFPEYRTTIGPVPTMRDDVRRFDRAIRAGRRYYPAAVDR